MEGVDVGEMFGHRIMQAVSSLCVPLAFPNGMRPACSSLSRDACDARACVSRTHRKQAHGGKPMFDGLARGDREPHDTCTAWRLPAPGAQVLSELSELSGAVELHGGEAVAGRARHRAMESCLCGDLGRKLEPTSTNRPR